MGLRQAWLTASVLVTLAVSAFAPMAEPAEPVRLLDVPYVPQSEALCGGAAVAMVLRYWGEPRVRAEDFEALLDPDGSGIRSDTLAAAVRARGWTAYPVTASADGIRGHLAAGRPVIALLDVGSGLAHYVVILAWANGGVVFHDPAVAPFRTRSESEFEAAWAARGRWALIVLPPEGRAGPAAPDSGATAAEMLVGCDAIVAAAIRLSRAGDGAGAESLLVSAASLCRGDAAPLRGLAGLRFAADDPAGAARLAARALELEPGDAYTWRLLAGSRFLLGDEVGALRAWNEVEEPTADLARVDGLDRIRYRAVAGQLDLPPGRLLTAGGFLRARRRLAEIPAQSSARLSLRPLPEGLARVDAAVLERPLVFDGALDAGASSVRAVVEREAALRVASPTGNGELWTAAYRWQRERPRAALTLATPAPAGRTGIVRVEGSWERQAYAGDGGVLREERRRSALSFADWVAPNLRLELGGAFDRWSGRGAHLALEGGFDARGAGDRLALRGELGLWTSLDRAAPFRAGGARLEWSPADPSRGGLHARAGFAGASPDAPLSLWPGAGTGRGRMALLRAHPLLVDGIVAGPAFGRRLAFAGVERDAWAGTVGPLRVGWTVFVDGARSSGALRASEAPWQVDAGAGVRIGAPGGGGELRLVAAHGLADGASALSLGWQGR